LCSYSVARPHHHPLPPRRSSDLRLVVCCTSAKLGTPEMWEQRAHTAVTRGMTEIADGSIERWFTPAWRAANPELTREYHRMTARSEEHTSELQSRENLVCRLLLE